MSRSCRRALALAGSALLLLAPAGPALAHPFGPPPTALVSARGNSVFIEWRSAADDAIAIGVEVGLLSEELVDVYLEGPAQAAPPEDRELELTASEALREYLVEHIVVEQAGERCRATVQPMDNFVHQGARTVHECPDPVEEVTITITMLHERHQAYRTFAISGSEDVNPQQEVFSIDNPQHTWDFAAERDSIPDTTTGGSSGVVWWPLATVGGVAVVGVLFMVLRGGESSP